MVRKVNMEITHPKACHDGWYGVLLFLKLGKNVGRASAERQYGYFSAGYLLRNQAMIVMGLDDLRFLIFFFLFCFVGHSYGSGR